jgi:hypothetical protein
MLYLVGEGNLKQRLRRDWGRFGPWARIRFFSATQEFPRHQGEPWRGNEPVKLDSDMETRGFSLSANLRPLVGKFVQLEVEWRK